jgi:hypothetical protein
MLDLEFAAARGDCAVIGVKCDASCADSDDAGICVVATGRLSNAATLSDRDVVFAWSISKLPWIFATASRIES